MVLLQACLNGTRPRAEHPAVPETRAALAADAVAAQAAGARALHVHPRAADGRESLAAADVGAALAAIRAAVPGMPVGISTGDWIAPGNVARQAAMRGWAGAALPDYVSVNLAEPDAPDVMALMAGLGVGIEAGLASVADARRLLGLDQAPDCLRILVEIPTGAVALARDAAEAVLSLLDGHPAPILLHGFDANAWELVRMAAERGLATRIGLEDVLTLPGGRLAASNAALVAAAATVLVGAKRPD